MKYDPFDYIRQAYNVPAKRGARVEFKGKPGTILRARGAHIIVQLDGQPSSKAGIYHPTWEMKYIG